MYSGPSMVKSFATKVNLYDKVRPPALTYQFITFSFSFSMIATMPFPDSLVYHPLDIRLDYICKMDGPMVEVTLSLTLHCDPST